MMPGFLQRLSLSWAALLLAVFLSGFLVHLLYGRWTGPEPCVEPATRAPAAAAGPGDEADLPVVDVMEVERLQELSGKEARVRGRVHRVGHSSRSNTYFLDFGPARSDFTAVVFSSALDAFVRENMDLKRLEGREVELTGRVKDDPKYGLEMILEGPEQIRLVP